MGIRKYKYFYSFYVYRDGCLFAYGDGIYESSKKVKSLPEVRKEIAEEQSKTTHFEILEKHIHLLAFNPI